MLTIRLKKGDVMCALQTACKVTLITKGDTGFAALAAIFNADERPDVANVNTDGRYKIQGERAEQELPPVAFLKLEQDASLFSLNEHQGVSALICIYEGDSAYVIDAGSKLFGYPL